MSQALSGLKSIGSRRTHARDVYPIDFEAPLPERELRLWEGRADDEVPGNQRTLP